MLSGAQYSYRGLTFNKLKEKPIVTKNIDTKFFKKN